MSTLTGTGRGGGSLERKPLWTVVLPGKLLWWRAEAKSLQPYVGGEFTLVRNGSALRINEDGVYESVAANEPRWHYIEEVG